MDSSKSNQKEASIIPINESLNFNQDQEDIFGSSAPFGSSQRIKNMGEEIYLFNDKDDDPNFPNIKIKKEEEARRRKAVEEFEKRKLNKNKNIIDYDEINEKKNKKNLEDTKVEEEGIIIENFNYISKPKNNNINHKNSFRKKNNEIEDLESKITQIKHLSSYSKDDLNINVTPDKNKKEKNKIINNIININKNANIIKESDYYPYNNFDINESNYDMNFYDTLRKSKNENTKNEIGVFESLLPNKSFKKFLKDKIKYYMDEKDIPSTFIKNLYHERGFNEISNSNENNNNNFETNYKSLDYEKLNLNIYQNENNNNNNFNKHNNNKMIKSNDIKRNKSMDSFHINKKRNNKNYNTNFNNNYNNVFMENDINKIELEEMKKELNEQKGEMKEKTYKINLLQNINDNLKQEMNKLQKNFENERIDNTQNRKNYAMIKNCYNEIKNQYDLLNMKYMTLNDENFNFRRNKELYERQIALKNEMIENLIENKTNLQKQKVKNQLNKINFSTKNSHKIISTFLLNNNENKKLEEKNINNNNLNKVNNNINSNNNIDYNKYDKLSFPELQCKRDELTKERKDINNIYSKIPIKTINKDIINKKNNLDKRLKEINCELMLVKLSIKNYQNHK